MTKEELHQRLAQLLDERCPYTKTNETALWQLGFLMSIITDIAYDDTKYLDLIRRRLKKDKD